ncbi:zeta toxin family protein [Crenothrix sp.]|uniref:zeta toxin family protein n=1 Tax=Crenothrix sp. TaxID=3100433 RepID=UPI00374D61C3
MPTCWIIAGPNGAGKTTFAMEYLPTVAGCRRFINADLIAAGLSPLAPEQHLLAASRLFLHEIEDCIAARQDFAFETTLAGRSYIKLIKRLQATGWRVELIYLALPSAEMSRLRVAERVAHGGHNIPEADLIRRFPRSLHNLLNVFAPKVDQVRCFMNSGAKPELVFQQASVVRTVLHPDFFLLLQRET